MQPKKEIKDNPKSLKVQQSSKQRRPKRTQTPAKYISFVLTFVAFSLPRTTKTMQTPVNSLANNLASFILNVSKLHGHYF